MTIADLKRLEEIRDELKRLRSRLEWLRNASTVSATNYSQIGAGGSTGDPVARTVYAMDDVEYRIGMLKVEGCGILRDVEPDSLQEVLALFYLEGLPSWAAVSRAMGKHRTYAGRVYRNFRKQLDNASTKSYN